MNPFLRDIIRTFCRKLRFDVFKYDRRPCTINRPPVGDMGTVLEDLKAKRFEM